MHPSVSVQVDRIVFQNLCYPRKFPAVHYSAVMLATLSGMLFCGIHPGETIRRLDGRIWFRYDPSRPGVGGRLLCAVFRRDTALFTASEYCLTCPARIRFDVNFTYLHRFSLTAVYGRRLERMRINAKMCSSSPRFKDFWKGSYDLISKGASILCDRLAGTSLGIFPFAFSIDGACSLESQPATNKNVHIMRPSNRDSFSVIIAFHPLKECSLRLQTIFFWESRSRLIRASSIEGHQSIEKIFDMICVLDSNRSFEKQSSRLISYFHSSEGTLFSPMNTARFNKRTTSSGTII